MADKFRIMIVDDEPDIAAILKPILEVEYEVAIATNGLDALLKLPRVEPDLMIVDLLMPLMDGWELAQNIRTNPTFFEIPIVFLTALDSNDDIRKGYNSGANLYLTKPFDPERIRKNIQVFHEQGGLEPRRKSRTMADLLREDQEARMREAQEKAQTQAQAHQAQQARPPVTRTFRRATQILDAEAAAAASVAAAPPAPAAPSVAVPPPRQTPLHPAPTAHRPQPTPAEPPLAPQPPRALGILPPRVMVVDDDPAIVDVIRLSLERGFEVVTACDGLDAVNKIASFEPDLFVIDGMMPKMSGFQLLQMLRSCAETRRAPVLFVSAKCEKKDRDYARSLGANNFLPKPFSPEQVVEALEKLCEAPGFTIKVPKQKTLGDLLIEEGYKKADEEKRQQKQTRWKSHEVLEQFLNRYGESDPYEKPQSK